MAPLREGLLAFLLGLEAGQVLLALLLGAVNGVAIIRLRLREVALAFAPHAVELGLLGLLQLAKSGVPLVSFALDRRFRADAFGLDLLLRAVAQVLDAGL